MGALSSVTERFEKLRKYVIETSKLNLVDLSFRADKSLPEIPIDPWSNSENEKRRVAHWLLLEAAIDQSELVGEAGNARKLLSALYYQNDLEEQVFHLQETDFRVNLKLLKSHLGRGNKRIPRILSDVNRFVGQQANSNLYEWGKTIFLPEEIVDKLAKGIFFMGNSLSNSARKKPWMFMRWMVRPKTDLRIWDHLNPANLKIPLDQNVGKVAVHFGVLPAILKDREVGLTSTNIFWPSYVGRDVDKVTHFALQLFPEDPAIVDYPFFLLGTSTSEGDVAKLKYYEIFSEKFPF